MMLKKRACLRTARLRAARLFCGFFIGSLVLAVGSCAPKPPVVASVAPPPAPPPAPKQGVYKIGAPYQTNGVWYYPSLDLTYDETGIASSFPADFREAATANGESFDSNALAAAHKTLPMPSIVQVTNLENGRQIQVRINDRGSYGPGRIIELTRHAADLLGMPPNGLARVRVQIMRTESIQVASLAGATVPGTDENGRPAEAAPQASPSGDVASQQLPPAAVARQSLATVPQESGSPAPSPLSARPTGPEMVGSGSAPVLPLIPGPPAGTTMQRSTTMASAASPPLPTAKPRMPQLAAAPMLSQNVRMVQVRPTQLYIQAGAFTRSANAAKTGSRLDRFGRVQIVSTRQARETLYRVRLGPLRSIDEADRLLARVIASGINEAKIVVD